MKEAIQLMLLVKSYHFKTIIIIFFYNDNNFTRITLSVQTQNSTRVPLVKCTTI